MYQSKPPVDWWSDDLRLHEQKTCAASCVQGWRWVEGSPFDYENWFHENPVHENQCMFFNRIGKTDVFHWNKDNRYELDHCVIKNVYDWMFSLEGGWSNYICSFEGPSICMKRDDSCWRQTSDLLMFYTKRFFFVLNHICKEATGTDLWLSLISFIVLQK